jgi:hypothetical protein
MSVLRRGDRRRAPSTLVLLDLALLGVMFWAAYHTYVAFGLARVDAVALSQDAFWSARVAEMLDARCREATDLTASKVRGADQVQRLVDLHGLLREREMLWRVYAKCQEPKTFVVPEDLLHFRVNMDAAFEGNPEPGFQAIRRYVDENVESRRAIFILGHTDDTFTDRYNNELSYRRARTIAGVIEDHLAAKGLKAGKDFAIYPIGMGKTQLLPPNPADVDGWRKACRRIELSFRAQGVGGHGFDDERSK